MDIILFELKWTNGVGYCMKGLRKAEFLLCNDKQQVVTYRNPKLQIYCIFRSSIKLLDMQMLLYPFVAVM